MAKKKINVKEVLADVKAGMHDNALMNKYDLSPGQLKSLMSKLQQAGLWEPPEPEPDQVSSSGLTTTPYEAMFTCPACGLNATGEHTECPRCGVVLSKYEPPPAPEPGSEGKLGEKAQQVKFDGWAATTPKSRTYLKILAVVLAIAVAVIAVSKIREYRRAQQAQSKPPQQVVHPEEFADRAGEGKASRYRDLIESRMPRVAPINPEVDDQMRRSLGDIGDALDQRNRAKRDLTNQP